MLRIILFTVFTALSVNGFSVSKRSFCGGGDAFLTQSGQVISSHAGLAHGHTYGRNMDCVWKIQAPEGMKVELVAKSFDLEDDSTCDYDYLMLYDGSDTSSSSIGKFCGMTFSPITSSGRYLTLRFVTDDDTQQGGFEIYYNFTTVDVRVCASNQFKCSNGRCIDSSYRCDNSDDCGDDSDELNCQNVAKPGNCDLDEFDCKDTNGCIPKSWLCDGDDDCDNASDELPGVCQAALTDARCGNTNQTGTNGEVASENYPNNYDANLHCIFTVQAPAGTKNIAFKFDDMFHMEPDSACDYDYVLIYSDGKSFKHGPFCGNVSPGQFTMPGDHAFVEYLSDDSDQYSGFRLSWKAIQARSAGQEKRFLFNSTSSTLPSVPVTMAPKCHQTVKVTTDMGHIVSPQYGRSKYPPRAYCTWELVAPIGQVIRLEFTDFSLQFSRSCNRDSVRIFDGLDTYSDLIGKYCGQVIPPDTESTGNKMTIFFHSDLGEEDKGFNITYYSVKQATIDVTIDDGCHGTPVVFNQSEGYISSPGYDGHLEYNNELSCSWLIVAPPGQVVNLRFEDFLTEKAPQCNYDYLTIYDGMNNSSKKISQLCGLQFPDDITSAGQYVFLHFKSDPDVAGRGFNLSFEFKNKEAPCNMFRCGDGSCIFEQMVCNKVTECPDATDELICDTGNCGRPTIPPAVSRKIVGGREAIPHSWPWMVSLRTNGIHQCGGAIINERWVISAGHCFEANRHTSEWSIAAGKHFELKPEGSVQVRQVTRIIVNSNYDYMKTDNDIALVRIDTPFIFNDNISAVCLPEVDIIPGDDGYVTGWGEVESSCCPGVLKQVKLPVISTPVCRGYLGDQVTGNMFCAGYEAGGQDACQGDSGGPYVLERSGKWHIEGITSFGSGCADAKSPGVYTRVFNYLEWIRQTIALNL